MTHVMAKSFVTVKTEKNCSSNHDVIRRKGENERETKFILFLKKRGKDEEALNWLYVFLPLFALSHFHFPTTFEFRSI